MLTYYNYKIKKDSISPTEYKLLHNIPCIHGQRHV